MQHVPVLDGGSDASRRRLAHEPLESGTVVGAYEIAAQIGAGGMDI